jgi:hypothetical protein
MKWTYQFFPLLPLIFAHGPDVSLHSVRGLPQSLITSYYSTAVLTKDWLSSLKREKERVARDEKRKENKKQIIIKYACTHYYLQYLIAGQRAITQRRTLYLGSSSGAQRAVPLTLKKLNPKKAKRV